MGLSQRKNHQSMVELFPTVIGPLVNAGTDAPRKRCAMHAPVAAPPYGASTFTTDTVPLGRNVTFTWPVLRRPMFGQHRSRRERAVAHVQRRQLSTSCAPPTAMSATMPPMNRPLMALVCSFAISACTETKTVAAPDLADGGVAPDAAPVVEEPTTVQGKSGTLFGKPATSYAKVNAENIVVAAGVTFELASLTTDTPKDHPFQDDLVLEMPAIAKQQTILNHLRANWLERGHGPSPYGAPHFDFHFLRGTIAEVDAIVCRADMQMPTADKLPAGYGAPELCVDAMGYHSWPKVDVAGGKFSGSLIMGYWKGSVIFLEPMIPVSTFTKKATFEIAIAKPASAGGKTTLYPTRMVASWDAATSQYTFEFNAFETID